MSRLGAAYGQGNINMMGTSPLEIANIEAMMPSLFVDPHFVDPMQGN